MYKFSIWLVLILIQTVFISLSAQSYAKIDPSLLSVFQSKKKAEYIILMKDRKVFQGTLPFKSKNEKANYVFQTLTHKAQKSQQAVIKILKDNGISYRSFYVTNAIKVTSDYNIMMLLAQRSDISHIIDDAPIKMLDYQIEKTKVHQREVEPEWGLKYIKADSAWQLGIRGQGVIVGGQDTGYDWEVSPLKSKYKGYRDSMDIVHDYNWHDAIIKNNPVFPDTVLNPCGYNTKQPCDDNNHGTHTMGTMVGEDSENIIGVAPAAKWIACRNMDRGWGQPSTYMDCFEWFLAPYNLDGENPDPDQAPHVINNSWYCSVEEGCNPSNFVLMEDIVKNLKASGIVVVVSAGNSGNQGCGSVTGPPAFFEASFSVGATDINGNIAGFSSLGPVVIDSSFRLKPNAAAPGVSVRSVIRNGNFAAFSGTSMAGPHIAGLVALIISANPALAGNVEAIEDIIEGTGIPSVSTVDCENIIGANVPNAIYGYGIGNAFEAVKRAQAFTLLVDDFHLPYVQVLPNPVDDLVTFVVTQGDHYIEQVEIFTLNGQLLIQQQQLGNHLLTTIQLDSLPKGIYIYKVKTGNKTSLGKIVKL
ncbi:MAG: S8 family peptidase [Saprospiraceae bacterium]|nr:S8 family peptidase [Saprospiraceae bacterium]